MSFLHRIAEIVDECKNEYEKIKEQGEEFRLDEAYGSDENILGYGDNLNFMKFLLRNREMKGRLDLIYVDPPFYSKADYSIKLNIQSEKLDEDVKVKQVAYTDNWEGGLEDYLKMICLRLYFMKELLSDTGSIWMHLDWHVSHYVKLIMDEVFGAENFINEVIWNYKSGGTSNRRFARKHDTLLFYGKTKEYYFEAQKEKSYNRGFKPYHFKGVEEFEDEVGWYTMVNMKDVWQLDMVGRTSSERTGYATQKPEALLERILKSCTKEGDICADFFGGSGTLAASASKMGRKWITCDMGANSLAAIKKRLISQHECFEVYKDLKLFKEFEGLSRGESAEVDEQKPLEIACICDDSEFGKKFVLSLQSYRPDATLLEKLKETDRKAIAKAVEKDPICLIESWSVDCEYDGKVHRPTEIHFRKKGILKDTVEKELGDIEKVCLSIRCLDIWGNEVKEIVEL